MRTANKTDTMRNEEKVDNLKLHRQMYERRLRLLKERDGLTDDDAANQANDPSLFDVENKESSDNE